MSIIEVFSAAGPLSLLRFGDNYAQCVIGRSGKKAAADKREGDGATPIGRWELRTVLWRPDRCIQPKTELPTQKLALENGWCDDPNDPRYNQPVTLPYPASAEKLWRDDGVYDLIVTLGHNDDPVVAGMGSAIFLHIAKSDWAPTEGCVAVTKTTLYAILAACSPGTAMSIR
jgi:L,D-peptidoglycan transpeptidase YkuD (ErfK/YbiS/YcfS/YnhG family)